MSHALIHFALVVNEKKRQQIKIDYVRALSGNNVKKAVIKALFDNIARQTYLRAYLSDKLETFSRILLRSALMQWHSKLLTLDLESTATWFHRVAWPKTLARRCLQELLTYSSSSRALRASFHTTNEKTSRGVKGKYMVRWLLKAA
jgi:hypothetical protein